MPARQARDRQKPGQRKVHIGTAAASCESVAFDLTGMDMDGAAHVNNLLDQIGLASVMGDGAYGGRFVWRWDRQEGKCKGERSFRPANPWRLSSPNGQRSESGLLPNGLPDSLKSNVL
jgi:hypothetical protein